MNLNSNRTIMKIIQSFFLFACIMGTGMAQEKSLVEKGATLELVAADYDFTEGPASDRHGNVFFTDQPNNRILKWNVSDNKVEVYLHPAGRANGLYFDHQGNLLACADEKFELWKIDPDKNVTVLLDSYDEKKLNGPNDLWIDKEGGIFFTDPYYQRPYWDRTEQEQKMQGVYYLSADQKSLKVIAEDLIRPNGIIASPDGKTIYISDIGDSKIYVYSIEDDNSLSEKKLFVAEKSDGMTIDELGNVYLTNDKGVTAYNGKGEEVLHIPIDQKWTANVTFGGAEQKILFITAMNSVYTIKMNVKGVRW